MKPLTIWEATRIVHDAIVALGMPCAGKELRMGSELWGPTFEAWAAQPYWQRRGYSDGWIVFYGMRCRLDAKLAPRGFVFDDMPLHLTQPGKPGNMVIGLFGGPADGKTFEIAAGHVLPGFVDVTHEGPVLANAPTVRVSRYAPDARQESGKPVRYVYEARNA